MAHALLVSTPFGIGSLSGAVSRVSDHTSAGEDDQDEREGFTRVVFPWGTAYLNENQIAKAPEFTFYALSKTQRIKFTLPFPLTGLGKDLVEAVRAKLELPDDVAITLVQTDSVSKHEIELDKQIGDCTIGTDAKHPILVLQAPLVRFDETKCSFFVVLHEKKAAAIQVAKGFGSVLGNMEISYGVKYWEVQLQSARGGEGVFVGVGILNRGIFWGISCATGHKVHDTIDYYTEPFRDGDVVGVLLDMEHCRLTFYKNGKNLGVAFSGINVKRLCPVFSLTFIGQKLKLLSTATSSSSMSSNNQVEGKVATFAAGCFWGVQLAFQRLPGVLESTVGYTNGQKKNPTYREVCTGETGHAEAIRIVYDDQLVKYGDLLKLFWQIHDPTTLNRQKNDVGTQYRSGIYYHDEDQKKEATASKEQRQTELTKPIVTEIEEAGEFWPAEDYHQRYLEKGGQCADKGCDTPIRCYG
ncbi:hypothetical protein P43SY_008876 [Pythium insidiosum]|uniref:peptide-methionine (S)-S-oxide reductase n=1 Tax=Pythium insidiosum TaxID=114742 RepID=A0AAD5LRB9_PYTIN|nr:hypothetical protein P43SY_008876 [Pythium insidiosum]